MKRGSGNKFASSSSKRRKQLRRHEGNGTLVRGLVRLAGIFWERSALGDGFAPHGLKNTGDWSFRTFTAIS